MDYLDYNGLKLYHNLLKELLGNISGSVNNGILTIKRNNTSVGTFSANQAANGEINISVPTTISDLDSSAITEILNIIKYGRPDVSNLTEEEKSNLEKYGQTDISGLSNELKQALEEAKIEALKDALNLEKVAFTGEYSDLYNLPVIYNILEIQNIVKYGQADISGLTQEQLDSLEKYGVADTTPYTEQELEEMAADKLTELGLHEVAKSGSYNDLDNKPTTLSGYGITDAKISNGVITLGNNTITPLTLHQNISGKVDKTTTINGHALSGNVTVSKSDVGLSNVTNDSQVKRSEMGIVNGVATLDSNGKVPSSLLPSYVDDVIEGYYYNSKFYKESSHTTVITGESGKIYTDLSTNTTYRWSGTVYTQIKGDLVIGTTTGTAADGKTANDHYSNKNNPHSVTKAQVGLGDVVNTGDSATPVSGGITKFTTGGAYTELAKKVDKVDGKGLSTNDYTTDEKTKLAGIAAGAEVNVQSDWNATSGDAFIKNKPTIPSAVTESTVSGWGFTKNTGTITGIKMNGSSKGTSGVVDLGTVITAHQDISGKVDKTTTVNGHALSSNVSVTKSDVGLGNVGNFKAVSTLASQGLTDTEKANARANIGAGMSSFSGNYNDLSNKPTIPAAAANGTYTVKTLVESTTTNVSDFTANQSSADDITFVQGSNVTITPDATNRKITIAATDTTYSSKTAASGGTDVSLVTTGEKYTWNSKTSNTGTVTKITAGAGLTGGDITTTGTIALATSGVTAGTYKRVTVDAYGRVTAGDQTDADSDTKNTAGTTNKTGTKMFLAAATELSANPVTYSNSNCYIGTDNCLYSGGNKVLTSYTNTTYAAGTGVTITGSNNAINVTYGTAANTACQGNDSRLSNSRPASDVYSWAKAANKPSYGYGEVSYSSASASVSGTVTVNGSTPLHVLTATGNISSISFTSGVPVDGHSCHIIIIADSDYTVALAHGSTVTISSTTYTFKCPLASDVSLTVKAGGYVELDLLRIGTNIYVRGV